MVVLGLGVVDVVVVVVVAVVISGLYTATFPPATEYWISPDLTGVDSTKSKGT